MQDIVGLERHATIEAVRALPSDAVVLYLTAFRDGAGHPLVPCKLQSEGYTGPITISNYQKFQWIREQLMKDGFNNPLPTGN